MPKIILESDDKRDLILIKQLADRLKIKYSIEKSNLKVSKTNSKELLKKNIDISNFGNPSDWQRDVRKDRNLI